MSLYALIVTVSDYAPAAGNLPGCKQDGDDIDAFFRDYAAVNDLEYVSERLSDQTARREDVIHGFTVFDNAGPDDICLFYYSGHGARMPAPPEFWNTERDHLCQTIVCYDSRKPGGRDLADKELAWLFHHHVTEGAQLLTIFDSCHSGTVTRGEARIKKTTTNTKQVPFADFLGSENYVRTGDYAAPPTRAHVALSACTDKQVAVEMELDQQPRGLFTHCLLTTFRQIDLALTSYANLLALTQTRVANRYPNQTVYGEPVGGVTLDTFFLDGSLRRSRQSLLDYDEQRRQWFLARGDIHGLRPGDTVRVEDHGKERSLTVASVEPGRSYVQGADWLSQTAAPYPILGINSRPAPVRIRAGESVSNLHLQNLKGRIKKNYADAIVLDEKAEFLVEIEAGKVGLHRNNNPHPLFVRSATENYDDWDEFLGRVVRIGRYENALAYAPAAYPLDVDAVLDVQLEQVFEDRPPVTQPLDGSATFAYRAIGNSIRAPRYRLSVRIKPGGPAQLHVGALYFDEDFGVKSAHLPVRTLYANDQEPYRTENTNDKNGQARDYRSLTIDRNRSARGVTEITNQLKLVVSEAPFSLEDFEQPGLEQEQFVPRSIQRGPVTRSGTVSRGDGGEEEEELLGAARWGVKNISLLIQKPLLAEGSPVSPSNIRIVSAPAGLDLSQRSLGSSKDRSRSVSGAAPPNFEDFGLVAAPLVRTRAEGDRPLDLIELKVSEENKEQYRAVNTDHPLVIGLPERQEDTIVFGIDEETGWYYPVGASDADGNVRIDQLPEPVEEENAKSLGGSIKLFFKKTVAEKMGNPAPGLLRKAVVDGEGNVSHQELSHLDLKAEVGKAGRIVLFVHGIIGDTDCSPGLMARATHPGSGKLVGHHYDLILTFDYENLGTRVIDTAGKLKDQLAEIGLRAGHGKTFHVYAHSMGGLVSRCYIEQLGGNEVVDHLVQFGTPNQGSPLPGAYGLMALGLSRLANGAIALWPLSTPLVKGFQWFLNSTQEGLGDMKPGSPFLLELNKERERTIPYSMVNGNIRLIGNAAEADKQAGFFKRVLRRFNRNDIVDTLLFRVPNDIAVSLDSQQKIPGPLPAHVVVAADHLSYFTDPAAIAGFETLLPTILGENP